jgi:hypothetical protein
MRAAGVLPQNVVTASPARARWERGGILIAARFALDVLGLPHRAHLVFSRRSAAHEASAHRVRRVHPRVWVRPSRSCSGRLVHVSRQGWRVREASKRDGIGALDDGGSGPMGVDRGKGLAAAGENNAFIRVAPRAWNALTQVVPVIPGRRYVLTAWMRTSGNVRDGYLGARTVPGNAIVAEKKFGPLEPYASRSVFFDAGDRTSVRVFIGYWALGQDSWIRIDHVSAREDSKSWLNRRSIAEHRARGAVQVPSRTGLRLSGDLAVGAAGVPDCWTGRGALGPASGRHAVRKRGPGFSYFPLAEIT